MKTYNEVTNMLEESIKDHNLAKMKDAILHCEETVYSSVGYAGPLIYAAECEFPEGVQFLLRTFYHDAVMGPDQCDHIWRIALFGWPDKIKTLVPILIEFNILPSRYFLATLASRIFKEKEETRDNIISSLSKELPDIEFGVIYHDTDTISIRKKQIPEGHMDDSGTPE